MLVLDAVPTLTYRGLPRQPRQMKDLGFVPNANMSRSTRTRLSARTHGKSANEPSDSEFGARDGALRRPC